MKAAEKLRDELAYVAQLRKRLRAVLVEIEEVVECIDERAETLPELWTAFDHRRTTLDLKTGARLVDGAEKKMAQVGSWKKT